MRQAVTVSLPEKLVKELDKLTRQEKTSRSDLIQESVRNYLFNRKFLAFSSRLIGKAQAQGIHTDQDVFKLVRARRKQPTLSLRQLKTRLKIKR
jgi:metal-responsive CopG/Arc/MetJ family transcriptional regulator